MNYNSIFSYSFLPGQESVDSHQQLKLRNISIVLLSKRNARLATIPSAGKRIGYTTKMIRVYLTNTYLL